jgi:hypothetical protein
MPAGYSRIVMETKAAMSLIPKSAGVLAKNRLLQYRCVGLDRLSTILRTGRDAEPPDGVFWAADRIGKALEYGGREQVLMVYDPRLLKSAWVQIGAECSAAERHEIERLYPTVVSDDG